MLRFWLVVAALLAGAAGLWLFAGPAAGVLLIFVVLGALYLLGSRGSGRHRNPVDAGGLWYRDQPYWRRLLIALLLAPVVIGWWLAYQLRRGWYGAAD